MGKAAVLIFTLGFFVWLVSTAQTYSLNDDLAEDDKFDVFHVEEKRKIDKKKRCCPESKYEFEPKAKSAQSNKKGLCLKKLDFHGLDRLIKLIRKDINIDLGKKKGSSKTALYAFKGYLYKYKVDARLGKCRLYFKTT